MDRRLIATDGLTQSVLEAGEGPLVLLIHGFPELAISWRAQIEALAEAGYRAVAPDMRGYGAGIVSSSTESKFSLDDPSPNRLGFDLERVMRTLYRIDDFQQVYFVIPSIEQLREVTLQDFGPIYDRLKDAEDLPIEAILPSDKVFTRGTQAYAEAGGRFAKAG